MTDITLKCPHCSQYLSAPSDLIGSDVVCPLCSRTLVVTAAAQEVEYSPRIESTEAPSREVSCGYCRTAIESDGTIKNCPACNMPHHYECWEENKGCTVFGCTMAPPDEDKISIEDATETSLAGHKIQHTSVPKGSGSGLFFFVPVSRLIAMSIFTFGLFEILWMYRNWKYLKERDNLKIMPFWRAFFGVFFCHSLLKSIHSDHEATTIVPPSFSAGGLATGWVVLILLGSMLNRSDDPAISLLGTLISFPTFFFFVPVQKYINSVNLRIQPLPAYAKWSFGHILCIVLFIVFLLISFASV